ncbi:MAG: hypothetical protein ACPG2Y_01290, partial [Acholeplasmataceae bacterium]
EETKHLIIDNMDVLKVYQYLMDKYDQKSYDGYIPVLIKEPYIEIVYRPTKEKAYEVKQQKLRQYLSLFDSDIYIQDATLNDFYQTSDIRKKALEIKKQQKGCTFMVHMGLGKAIYYLRLQRIMLIMISMSFLLMSQI